MSNRSMLLAAVLIVLLFLGVWYVSSKSNPPSEDKVSVAIGDRKTVKDTTIGVLELIEDSRCPVDVQCIQAGTVRVRVALNAMSRDFIFELNQPQAVVNKRIILIDVEPREKRSTQPVDQKDYHFTFGVEELSEPVVTEYRNTTYGISFNYPNLYELAESTVVSGERDHYAIVLTRKTDLPPPENAEGPPTITIDLFQNNLDKLSLLEWLKGSNQSNFKLTNGGYASTTVAGVPGVRYSWSGLYEADAVAFIHKDSIIMVSGMYMNETDPIREDFENLISAIKLF